MPILEQKDFSGGLADSKWRGAVGSLSKMLAVDIHSTPGTITVLQKLAKDSVAIVDTFCRVALSLSTGDQLWFSYTTGKIYYRVGSSGAWSLAYTTVPTSGGAGCLGACEYNGFVYWATQNWLHRIAIGNVATWASPVPNWNQFGVGDAEFHPMAVVNNGLYIGDANQIASVNTSATFTANALNILTPDRVKSLFAYNIDLLIGTIRGTATSLSLVGLSYVYRWDTIQTTWQYAEPVLENGINCFLWTGEELLVQAGTSGNWYRYEGDGPLSPYRRMPGTWTSTAFGEVYPDSKGVWQNRAIFGLSNSPNAANSTGNPADMGIYSFGRYSKDYPRVLSGVDFVISQDKVATIEVGAILVENSVIYAAWKDGSNFGVDKLDYSNKYASAYIERMIEILDPKRPRTFTHFFANYNSLPASTNLTFKYSKNGGSYVTSAAATNNANDNILFSKESVIARAIQQRVDFTISGNNAPVLESVGMEYAEPSR